AEPTHDWPRKRNDGNSGQRDAGRFVRIVVSVEEGFVASGQMKRIDIERVLVGDRANQRKPRILIPPAGLVEVCVRREEQDEQRHFRSGHQLRPRRPPTSTTMLTTSPTTVANAA